VTTLGTVKSWNDDEGWGVLTSPELDEDVWAHFAYVEAEGFRELGPGAAVEFDYEQPPGGQDGFTYRATRVRQLDP